MGNYVIAGVGNYVIVNPSNLGNYVIADMMGTASAGVGGLITPDLVRQTLLLVPLTLLGVGVGSWWFRRTGAEDVRRYVLWLLVGLACLIVSQALRS